MNTIIHAAVRRDVARFEAALDAFPDGDRARALQLGAAWANLHHQLSTHHHDEETLFWPALRELGAQEALVGDLGGEHQRMAAAMVGCDAAMTALQSAPDAATATRARAAFDELHEIIDAHFAHEERDLEPMLADHHDSAPIKAAVKQVRRAQPPPQAGTFLAWLQDGAAPDDRAALAREIPRPVLWVFGRLFGRTYNRTVKPVWA
jgi:hypothetical protein